MINVFDLSTSMAGTKVLAEKAHQDGSPIRRVVSEMVKKALDPVGGHAQTKPVTQESKHVGKYMGTPIKMLMEQEMLKELGRQRKPPVVVAKLMGLETCSSEEFDRITGRIVVGSKTHKACGTHKTQCGSHRVKRNYNDRIIRSGGHSFSARLDESRGCKDVYEIPSGTSCFANGCRPDSMSNDAPSEKRMALVRQKFAEAKRMAMNEKLLQSKEFQEALHILNSNKELFLKLIEEPNGLVSKRFYGLQESASQAKRITVLKPSRQQEVGLGGETDVDFPSQENGVIRDSYLIHPKDDIISHPARIVVLRPSPSTTEEAESLVTSPVTSSRGLSKKMNVGDAEMGGLTDEMFSVLSNGYNGDESSINMSEDEYMDDEFCSFSESDDESPASHHSCHDHIDRSESPLSTSFFSPPPYAHESTVILEAKKRLSQRWAKVTSCKPTTERKLMAKSTSTLGEMLSEAKKEEARDKMSLAEKLQVGGQELQAVSSTCFVDSGSSIDGTHSIENKSRGLLRSKSAPVLSSNHKAESFAANGKARRSKSLFSVKVSSLFSLKSKKPCEDKCSTRQLTGSSEISGKDGSNSCHDVSSCASSEASSCVSKDLPTYSSSDQVAQIPETLSQASVPLEKLGSLESAAESPGQPSPVSVLESPFRDDVKCNISQACESALLQSHRGISRSPPIESIARSLSWEDSSHCGGNLFSHHRRHSTGLFEVNAEEHDRVMFIRDLLTAAGLDGETDCSVLTKWHPVDSPLSPLLLDKLLGCKGEDARGRWRRAQRRLLFDCVSAILLELGSSDTKDRRPPPTWCLPLPRGGAPPPHGRSSVTEAVLGRIQDLFSHEEKWPCELRCSQVVDGMVRKEVVGGAAWAEMGEAEHVELGKEFETELMEELVGEALDDFICS